MAVDSTVQPKAVAHPSDARLMHRTISGFAKRSRVPLPQSHRRHGGASRHQDRRYSRAHQY
jgi:IS5 family transposase